MLEPEPLAGGPTTSALILVDETGQMRAGFGVRRDGAVALSLYDAGGLPRVSLSDRDGGGARLVFHPAPEGRSRGEVGLAVDENEQTIFVKTRSADRQVQPGDS